MFQRCLATTGHHAFVSESTTPGSNVFVDGLADICNSDSGPHHRYASGQLYDPFTDLIGIVQSENQHMAPRSLYYVQVKGRVGTNALHSNVLPSHSGCFVDME